MSVFKAYDIRGIYNKDFNKDDVYKIGFFLPKLLSANKVLVGRDDRLSSPEIFKYLCKGITDSGADVYSIGLATTPMVYYATAEHKFVASVQITASHNPKEYNGLKISKQGALPVGYETGLAELEKMISEVNIADRSIIDKNIIDKNIIDKNIIDKNIIDKNIIDTYNPSKTKGRVIEFNIKEEYAAFLRRYLPEISGLKLAVDCSNGMAGLVIKDILGSDPIYLYDEIDGTFPNHEPNPLIEDNVKDLKKTVLKNACDIGIIYDGDADRVMFVDERGRFVPPDLIIGVMAHYYLKNEKGNVLHDIRTSKAVSEYIRNLGGVPHMWKVGHAFAKLKLREINGIFGGELAGHYYFRDFFNCDSGILASLIVLNVMAELKGEGKLFSDMIDSIGKYSNSGEINYKIENKYGAMEELKAKFMKAEKANEFYDFDGFRIEFDNWWFNVRASNTEPYLRLVVEAKDEELLALKLKSINDVLDRY